MRRLLSLLLPLALMVSACTGTGANTSGDGGVPEKLRVGLIPNIAPEDQKAKYRPFAEHLQRALGVRVELFVAADYAGVVSALAGDRIDVAYLGGLTYAQAERQVKLVPLVTEIDHETGDTTYFSAVVVRGDSAYRDLRADIVRAGRTFAFGDPGSTSGSLYPRAMLTAAGAQCSTRQVDRCPPLRRVTFTGGHDATAQAVLGGQVDAGGLELRILHRLEREGKVPKGALRVIAQQRVQGYPWVMRADLGERARERLVNAFTQIADARLLDLMRARRYVAIKASDYDELRRKATDLGLLEGR